MATPDLAVLSEDMRLTVKTAAAKLMVAVVSGRATDDVRGKVAIDGIFYAGSHGFEIVDPQGQVTINPQAQKIRSVIDEAHKRLSDRLKGVKGALVEHVKYTISSHYRLVSAQDFLKVKEAVDQILKEYPQLRKTDGKKVFEIRPRIDWDKGKAVEWILRFLKSDSQKDIPVYIGDDTTDEDAFRLLEGRGLGILVAGEAKKSFAAYTIADTPAVKRVLEFFVEAAV